MSRCKEAASQAIYSNDRFDRSRMPSVSQRRFIFWRQTGDLESEIWRGYYDERVYIRRGKQSHRRLGFHWIFYAVNVNPWITKPFKMEKTFLHPWFRSTAI